MSKKRPAMLKKPKPPKAPARLATAATDLPCSVCGVKGPSNRRVTIKDHVVQMATDGNDLGYSAGELSTTCDLCPTHAIALRNAVITAIYNNGFPTSYDPFNLPTAKECTE